MKLLKLVLALFIVVSMSQFAQAQTSGWEAGVNVSGGASDYAIANVDNNIFAKTAADNIRDYVKPKFYYSVGIYGRKFFKDMYGVELGVQYSSFGAGPQRSKLYGWSGELIGTSTSIARHNYVDIPVRFVFKKDIGDFAVGGYAGLAPAFLTHSYARSVTRINDDKSVDKNSNNDIVPKFNLFIDMGVLFRYNITEQLAIDTKPFFRISPLNAYTEANSPQFDALLLAGGLNVGTVWKF